METNMYPYNSKEECIKDLELRIKQNEKFLKQARINNDDDWIDQLLIALDKLYAQLAEHRS